MRNSFSLFNLKVENRLKNSVWGLVLVFQKVREDRKFTSKYLLFFVISWSFTFLSLYQLILSVKDKSGIALKILDFIPFLSFVVLNSSFPYLDYRGRIEELKPITSIESSHILSEFGNYSWAIYTLPYILIGALTVILTITPRSSLKTKSEYKRTLSVRNTAPEKFLDGLFLKERIAENIHQRSILENFAVIEYFKGGSEAVTMLVERNHLKTVRKVVGANGRDKLLLQKKWLENMNSHGIVKVLDSKSTSDFYEIEIDYIDNSCSFFDYIHNNSLESSKRILNSAIGILYEDVYGNIKTKNVAKELKTYLAINLFARVSQVTDNNSQLLELSLSKLPLEINGEFCLNLHEVMQKIAENQQCMDFLNQMSTSTRCHGDFTVDNILVKKQIDKPVLIDPSDDNLLKGPLVDFSRLMQSLLGGYEFLNQDDSQVEVTYRKDVVTIKYNDLTSSRYSELSKWLIEDVLPKHLSKNEIMSIKFHVGVFFARMLTHRQVINDKTLIKYYAVALVFLNEFFKDVSNECK
jgi:hypothetical protein